MTPYSSIRKIVALFDFSECSQNAVSYAMGLAQDINCEVHILHCFNFTGHYFLNRDNEKALLKKQEKLSSEMEEVIGILLKGRDISIKQYCKAGTLTLETKKLAAILNADTVIMGTYSKNPLKRMLMGSSTLDLLESSEIPVWVIPPLFHYKGIKKVCYITNYHSGSIPSMHKINEMLSPLDPHITLLHFVTDQSGVERRNNFLQLIREDPYLRDIPIEEVKAKSLLLGTRDYGLQNSVDLIGMASKKRKGIASLFITTSQSEAVYTRIPLLVVPRSGVVIDIAMDDSELP